MTRSREVSEDRVVAAVREWLPSLPTGAVIYIRKIDPEEDRDGAHFAVSGVPPAFVCTRGSDRGSH